MVMPVSYVIQVDIGSINVISLPKKRKDELNCLNYLLNGFGEVLTLLLTHLMLTWEKELILKD